MRVVVVGGSGHVGTYLVPRLVRGGHEVVVVSRGQRSAYTPDEAWSQVQQVHLDREAEDRAGTFAARLLEHDPEAVVDLVCFTVDSAAALVEGLRGRVEHLVHCGSIWRYGPSRVVPVTEENASPPLGDYGTAKAAIVRLLRDETASGGLVTTSLHPGHISGPGWEPIGPLGNLDLGVWRTLSAGEPLAVPGFGAELLHHVHADDVAQAFELAIERRSAAAGLALDVVAPTATTVRGLAEAGASWFGREADLRHVGWDEFRASTTDELAEQSHDHLVRSHHVSIERTREVLGYAPVWHAQDAVLDAVRRLVADGRLEPAAPLVV
ncbi:hypothetical protein GCM10028777_37030 [Angustibacter speluncae]